MDQHPAHGEPSGAFWTSRSFALTTLLVANLATICFFVFYGGSILQALWIYWLQSVIIGVVNVRRLLSNSTVIQVQAINDVPVPPEESIKYRGPMRKFFAFFFTFHYGGFHLIYMFFLIAFTTGSPVTINNVKMVVDLGAANFGAVLLAGLGFAVHHVLTFAEEQRAFRLNPAAHTNNGSAMFRPYARVLPMHLIIIMGPIIVLDHGNTQAFIVFMILKTIADVVLFYVGSGHPKLTPANPSVAPSVVHHQIAKP